MVYLKTLKPAGRFFRIIQGRFSEAGISDIAGCFYGRFIAIEVKSSKGVPSKKQISFQKQIKGAGGIAIIAYSVSDVEEIIKEVSCYVENA